MRMDAFFLNTMYAFVRRSCSNQPKAVYYATGFVSGLLCPCGKPQCNVCNATNRRECIRNQQLQICPNVEVWTTARTDEHLA